MTAPSARLTTKQLALGLVTFAALAFVGYLLWLDRPGTLGLDYNSHAVTPSVKQMQVNGRMMVRDSVTGRGESGGASYAHRFTDRMDFVVLWYDFLEERAWTAEFSVHGRELSTFGNKRNHAMLEVQVGPGADVTVTTSNQAAMRLTGLRRQQEIFGPDRRVLPQYRDPVVLRELCARPVPVDDPEIRFMIERSTAEMQFHIDRAFDAVTRTYGEGPFPQPRCKQD